MVLLSKDYLCCGMGKNLFQAIVSLLESRTLLKR